MFIPLSQRPATTLRPATSLIAQADWDILARFWYPVAVASRLGSEPMKAKLLDVELVLFRGEEQAIGAVLDVCPHRQIRLSAGRVIEGQITCPFHGLRFDTAGRCRLVPALGPDRKLPASYKVRSFPVQVKYGLIWTCLGPTSEHRLPDFPQFEGIAESQLGFGTPRDWPVSAARQIENFFDLAHLPLIHAQTIGGLASQPVRPGLIEESPDGVILRAEYIETPFGGAPKECEFTYRVILPFAIDFTVKEKQSGSTLRSCNIPAPISAYVSRVFQIVMLPAQVASQGPEARQAFVDGFDVVNQEDINVLDHLARPEMPLDQHHEVHLPVDNICNAYRARLRKLGLGH